MFRSLGRCRTGMFIVAGTLVASGLLARETRGVRQTETLPTEIISAPSLPVAVGEGISLDLQIETLYGRLKSMGDRPEGLSAPFDAFVQGLKEGRIDDAAIWAAVATIPDAKVQDKAELVMRDFAERVLAGQLGFDLPEFAMEDRPLELRTGVIDSENFAPKALCNTCTTANTIANPTTSCQYVSGNTTSACPSDYYQLTLTAGTTYQFTFCPATCPSATASYDSYLYILSSGACATLASNDDSCGLQSQLNFTPSTTGVYVVRVAGFSTAFGSYTLGYKSLPASTCGSCATPAATITPTTTCQTVSGNNTTCPNSSTATTTTGGVWYNVNLTAGRSYTFSTCPNNAAGGSCFGTASFDTRLDLWNSTCTTRLAGNDDISCTLIFRSAFLYNCTTTGTYKLQVRGFSADNGTYTLGYQEMSACNAPAVTSNTPTTGNTSSTSCSVSQGFTVGLSALSTPPFTGTWNIVAPVGATASPASGSMTFSGNNGSFSSTLTKPACGTANFTVNATISNACGTTTRSWTYTLRDATAPTVTGCPASVQLDCAAPDPAAPTLSATDNCDPAPTVTFAQTRVNGSCPGNFTTRRTWTARDCNGNTGVCTQNINHRDTTPPTISGADAWCMYPPNHEYYCLQSSSLSPTLSDDCSMPATLAVVGCVSNEPDEGTGDGDFPNDCIVSPDGKEVCLRVERAGSGSDRVYGILGIAIDSCGNRSAPQVIAIATVPHDDSEDHSDCRPANGGLDKHF